MKIPKKCKECKLIRGLNDKYYCELKWRLSGEVYEVSMNCNKCPKKKMEK